MAEVGRHGRGDRGGNDRRAPLQGALVAQPNYGWPAGGGHPPSRTSLSVSPGGVIFNSKVLLIFRLSWS
jgi:hypothetical protein